MNPSIPLTTPDSGGDSQADCIIRHWLEPFTGGVGRGMNVRVYTKERCGACGKSFDAEMRCREHRGVRPQKVFLSVTGVKGYRDCRQKIYAYPDTKATLTLTNFMALKRQIEHEISAHVYDPRKYDSRQADRLRYKNYAVYYLKELEGRTKEKQGSDGWLSKSGYKDLEQYQRLYLISGMNDVSIREITRRHIKNFLDKLRSVQTGEPASDTVKRKTRDALRHLMNWAVDMEDIPPLAFEFPEVKHGKQTIQTLTEEAQDSVIAAMPEKHRPIFVWWKKTGHRGNQVRAIRRRDIDYGKKEYCAVGAFDGETYKPFVKVASKTGSVFPMDDEMLTIAGKALEGRVYGADDYVFINPSTGKHYTHAALYWIYKKASKAAGLSHVEMNMAFRHSWVTNRLKEGWTYDQIAMFTGNSPRILEQTYANVDVAMRQSVISLHAAAEKRRRQAPGDKLGTGF